MLRGLLEVQGSYSCESVKDIEYLFGNNLVGIISINKQSIIQSKIVIR